MVNLVSQETFRCLNLENYFFLLNIDETTFDSNIKSFDIFRQQIMTEFGLRFQYFSQYSFLYQ